MLFSHKDIDKENSESDVLGFNSLKSESAHDLFQLMGKAKDLCKNLLDELTPNKHIDFCTAGELNLHHLLTYALTITGEADVYISSWAIKEEPARALLFLKESGKIKQLFGIFDYRVESTDAKHFELIKNAFSSYKLTKNHSKVIVIIGQNLSISIVSSANLSNNPRIEAGFISTCKPTIDFHKQWMEKVLSGKTVY